MPTVCDIAIIPEPDLAQSKFHNIQHFETHSPSLYNRTVIVSYMHGDLIISKWRSHKMRHWRQSRIVTDTTKNELSHPCHPYCTDGYGIASNTILSMLSQQHATLGPSYSRTMRRRYGIGASTCECLASSTRIDAASRENLDDTL